MSLYDFVTVSSAHARLAFETGAWFIEDRGSRNGTEHRRGSELLAAGKQLRIGDVIRLPGHDRRRDVELRIVDIDPPRSLEPVFNPLATTELVQGGRTVVQAPPRAPLKLTEKEAAVLRLCAEEPHLTNAEVAVVLGVGRDRIRDILKGVYARLGIVDVEDKRRRAIEVAQEHGLLTPPGDD